MQRALRLSVALAVLFLGTLVTPAFVQAKGKRVALVIGNNAYHRFSKLTNCVNDARALETSLTSLGFQVKALVDADRSAVDGGLTWLESQVSDAELGVFYFSGHGVQVNGQNYLVPIDADADNEIQVKRQAINASQVSEDLRASGCSTSVLILDACRNEPFARQFRGTASRGLAAMQPSPGSLIAFAADAGQVADDNPAESNGLYTSELLTHLRTPGIRLEDVFIRTRRGVLKRSGNRQAPAEYSMLLQEVHMSPPTPTEQAPPGPTSSVAMPLPVTSRAEAPRPGSTARSGRPDPEDCFALSIGVGKFASGRYPLSTPQKDASLFRKLLVDGMHLPESHVRVLIDERASLQEIGDQLRWLASEARPERTLYLFFSGHGSEHGTGGVLVPHDHVSGSGSTPPTNLLHSRNLREWLGTVRGARVVIVLDASHAEAMAGDMEGQGPARRSVPTLPRGTALLAACAWNGVSFAADTGSMFTLMLVDLARDGLTLAALGNAARKAAEPRLRSLTERAKAALGEYKPSLLPVLIDRTEDPTFVPFWVTGR